MSLLIGVAHATKHPLYIQASGYIDWAFMALGPALALSLGVWGGRSGQQRWIALGAALGVVGAALVSPRGLEAAVHIVCCAAVGGWIGAAARVQAWVSLSLACLLTLAALALMQLTTVGLALVLIGWPAVGLVGAAALARHRRTAAKREASP